MSINSEQNQDAQQGLSHAHVASYASLYTIFQVIAILSIINFYFNDFGIINVYILDNWINTYIFCLLMDSKFPWWIWFF